MRKLLILVDGPVDIRLTQSIVAARWDVHIANTLERARDTLERYRFQVGFSYQFGSIYNNVVNPRWSSTTGRGYGGPGGR